MFSNFTDWNILQPTDSLNPRRPRNPFSSCHIWMWGIFVVCAVLAQGCSCGVGIVQDPSSQTGQGVQGNNKQGNNAIPPTANTAEATESSDASDSTTPSAPSPIRPSRYQIRGVAMVAFYPGSTPKTTPFVDPQIGSMNGYVVITDKPQETVISAWGMKDGECQFEALPYAQNESPTPIRGLNAGTGLTVQVADKQLTLEPRQKQLSGTSELDTIYNIPTTPDYAFPYQQKVVFQSVGSPEVKAFRLELQAPAMLQIQEPALNTTGTTITRQKDLTLRWKTLDSMEYLALRINQNLRDKQETRSLFCRFANTGTAILTTSHLQQLAPDPEGTSTSLYLFSTTYKLSPIAGFTEPVLTVVRATITVPVRLP